MAIKGLPGSPSIATRGLEGPFGAERAHAGPVSWLVSLLPQAAPVVNCKDGSPRCAASSRMDTMPITSTLKNGLQVTLRELRPDDRDRIAKAVRGLDAQSVYTRLFAHRKELTEAGLDRIMRVDPDREVVLVTTTGAGADEAIIGAGRYIVTSDAPARKAEIAFTVEEDYQGQGIAGRLLQALAAVARDRGIAVFEADVLAENPSMLRVFERTGWPLRRRSEGGVVHLELALT
jgi:RimJ/RimL family protein N-acetyltransferase